MDVYVRIRVVSLAALREQVRRLEELGVKGVLLTDHLFVGNGGPRAEVSRPVEPMTLLGAVAALSDRLSVGTVVSNAGLLHPALLIRQFAQLAVLVGGERVLAGLGAGWNREEFEALGMAMPGFSARMDRLEEAARLARDLFDHGLASLDGTQVVAHDLPLAPLPSTPPRILLGGGSNQLLEIAGRYADMLDLNGSSRRRPVSGPNLPRADKQRRLTTTVGDLEESAGRVRGAAQAAGRPQGAVSLMILMDHVVFCRPAEVADTASRIAQGLGLPGQPVSDCPYVLLGEPQAMAETLIERQRRIGLEAVSSAEADAERFCREVLPRLR